MKKGFFSLILAFCAISYVQAQPSQVIEDGVTYTRVLTLNDYLSVGGFAIGISQPGESAQRKTGNTIDCKKGGGCCLATSVSTNESSIITGIAIPPQNDPQTGLPVITSPLSGLFAFYNSELERIIFR